jgi:hypothetical protein
VGAAPTGDVVVVMVELIRLRLPERLAHVERVLSIGVVLGLYIVDLVPESGGVEVEGGAVGSADVEGDVLGAKDLVHGCLRGGHELGGEPELAVGAEHREGGDVAVAVRPSRGRGGGAAWSRWRRGLVAVAVAAWTGRGGSTARGGAAAARPGAGERGTSVGGMRQVRERRLERERVARVWDLHLGFQE